MGRWLQVVLLLSSVGFALSASSYAHASDLSEGRKRLEANDFAGAAKYFANIKPDSPDWSDRLEDTIRLNTLTGAPQEAWRLTQIAQRTRTHIPHLSYYRQLAMVLFGSCAFDAETNNDHGRYNLLHANQYRFFNRFRSIGYNWSSDSDLNNKTVTSHLSESGVHYLHDIPKAQLIKGNGCRFYRGRLNTPKEAVKYEQSEMHSWYQLTVKQNVRVSGDEQALLRLTFLLDASKEFPEDKLAILGEFAKNDDKFWLNLSSGERLWLWDKLQDEGLRDAFGKIPDTERRQIKTFIMHGNEPETVQWLALIPLEDWEFKERKEILLHLVDLDAVPRRSFLLASLAASHYQEGQWREAMGLIRRLLVEGESSGDANVEEYAIALAATMLREYKFSNEVLGAIQTALPSERWQGIYRSLVIAYALSGDLSSYQRVQNYYAEHKNSGRRSLFRKEDEVIFNALATRNITAFRAEVNRWGTLRRMSGQQLNLMKQLMLRIYDMSDAEKKVLTPYMQALADYSQKMLGRGAEQKQIEELVHFFARSYDDGWIASSRDVRSGTQTTGVVDLRKVTLLANPYTWDPPKTLPLKPLLLMPDKSYNRSWVIR